MATDLKARMVASLQVAQLTASALCNKEVAEQLLSRPAQVAVAHGLAVEDTSISARLIQKGQQSVTLSVWL